MKTFLYIFTLCTFLLVGVHTAPLSLEESSLSSAAVTTVCCEHLETQLQSDEDTQFLFEFDYVPEQWAGLHHTWNEVPSEFQQVSRADNSNKHLLRSHRIGLPPPAIALAV